MGHRFNSCASNKGGKSPCLGDSGGPLAYDDLLIGVTSLIPSNGCGSDMPTAFSRVTSYLQWIDDNSGVKS